MDGVAKPKGLFCRMLRNELYRGLCGMGFWIAVACFVAFEVLSDQALFTGVYSNLSIYETAAYLSASEFQTLLPCVCAVSYALSVVQDMETNYLRFLILRVGETRYLFAKVIAALTSAFGVAFVGLTFTYLLLATQYNLTPQISEWNAGGTLVLEGHIVGYWLLQFAVRSLSLGCWVLLTLAVAAWTRNRYIAVLSPLLFGYMLDILVSLCAQIPVVGTGLYQWYCAYPYKYIASGDAPFFRAWDYLKAFMLAYAPYFVIFILANILVLRKRVKEHV